MKKMCFRDIEKCDETGYAKNRYSTMSICSNMEHNGYMAG